MEDNYKLYYFKDEDEFFRLTPEQVRLLDWLVDHNYMSLGQFNEIDDTIGRDI